MKKLYKLLLICLLTIAGGGDVLNAHVHESTHVSGSRLQGEFDSCLELDQTEMIIAVGHSAKLNASVGSYPPTHEPGNITFTSGNSNIATVDNNGNIYAIAAGEVTITVKLALKYIHIDSGTDYYDYAEQTCHVMVCGHDYSYHNTTTDNGDGTHSFICTECNTEVTEAHTGTEATCTTEAACTLCGASYINPNNHEYENNNGICCGTYQAAELNADGFYEIYNAGNLFWFAELVNGGGAAERSLNAILMADIDLENRSWNPITSTVLYYNTTSYSNAGYTGTFDGNYHVISNFNITGSSTADVSHGLFGTLSGTIKNLGVENYTYRSNGKDTRIGTIAGQMLNGSMVENCYVIEADIDTKINTTNGVAGGIAGCNYAGTIKNSYSYNVTINAGRGGGIVGDNRGDGGETDRPGTIDNCYTNYSNLYSQGVNQNVTGEAGVFNIRFASGEITYKLNNNTSIWKQNEDLPAFIGDVIYQITCEGLIAYSTSNENHDYHELASDFSCIHCSNYDQPNLTDNIYQIENESQLFWFSENVLKGNTDIDAVLLNDLNLNNVEWIPIGISSAYTGTFNGNGKSISGFKMTISSQGNFGLFSNVNNATIKEFTISGAATSNRATNNTFNYGSIVGRSDGNTSISNVHSSINFTCNDVAINTGDKIGGLIGFAQSSGLNMDRCSYSGTIDVGTNDIDCLSGVISYINANITANISNCTFDGKIISELNTSDQIGGLIGYYRGSGLSLKNSLSVGEITVPEGCTMLTGAIIGVLRQHTQANSKIKDNYYKSGNAFGNSTSNDDITDGYGGQTVNGSATKVTEKQLASGEIAYKLQGTQATQIWGQNIDNGETADSKPILGGAKVYGIIYDGGGIYSNTNITAGGKCGDNLYWKVSDNTLTIFGTGAMYDYGAYINKAPWRSLNTAPKSLVLEEGITYIGNYAFYKCSSFKGSLTIPNSVTTIGSSAFDDCSGFKGSLTIPNNVTTIKDHAFAYCSGFTGSLTIPNSVTIIGSSAFEYCSGFKGSLTIPNNVTTIKDHAFAYCSGFTGSLTIPNSVTTIGEYAFCDCEGFKGSLTIPNSVTSIGNNAFYGCSGFTGSLTIPNSVTNISNYAFQNCSGFTGSLTIPNSVTSIGNYAFYGCSGFTGSLTIPNSVTTIGEYAFCDCEGFTGSLTIPNSVTTIGSCAFKNCSGFTGSLTIPNSVTNISNYAFQNCYGFTGSLTIPNSVTSIGREAFYNCKGFKGSLTIPNSVTNIGDWAFDGCSGFTGSLTIPNSVTNIGREAFYNCKGFTDIFFYRDTKPTIGASAFSNINANAKVYAPVIWSSYSGIPSGKLVKMATFVGQQTTDNGQQSSSTGWVGLAEGRTEPGEDDHVAVNAPLVLGSQQDNNTTRQQGRDVTPVASEILEVKSFGLCGNENTTNGSITIEDGGQLYCEVARGEVTVKKEILGYQQSAVSGQQSESKWYTIASPLKDTIQITPNSTLLTPNSDYDLYRYDEPTYTWQNAKPGENSTNFQTLDPGRGYLYANAENTTLEFKGMINTETVTYNLTAKSDVLNGFHLVGNPFTHNITFAHLNATEGAELVNGYYVLNGEGAWGATLGSDDDDVIKVGQGVLVKATAEGTLAISCQPSAVSRQQSRNGSQLIAHSSLQLTVSNAKYSDRAFVVFGKGVGLDKMNHENEDIPLLYIPMEDADYAIAMMDINVNEIPVNFETNVMGQYTISLRQENCEFEELYLLDKETDEKVNILEQDYTFIATSSDNPERFILMKDAQGSQLEAQSHFAYINNGDIIIQDIEGDADIKIFDALGRCVYQGESSDETTRIANGYSAGVYMIQKVDDKGVNVQKIIL